MLVLRRQFLYVVFILTLLSKILKPSNKWTDQHKLSWQKTSLEETAWHIDMNVNVGLVSSQKCCYWRWSLTQQVAILLTWVTVCRTVKQKLVFVSEWMRRAHKPDYLCQSGLWHHVGHDSHTRTHWSVFYKNCISQSGTNSQNTGKLNDWLCEQSRCILQTCKLL